MQPGDAAWVAGAADVAEVQHVGGGHVLVFPIRPVGDDAVAGGRAELIKQDAVVGAVGGVGGAADGLAADEADAGAACFGADELGEEVAVNGNLAEDEGLRAVEIHLGAGVEGPRLGAGAILEESLGAAVPLGVGGAGLRDDAGADGALGEMLDEVGGDADVVVKPAGFLKKLEAGGGRGFALGLEGV